MPSAEFVVIPIPVDVWLARAAHRDPDVVDEYTEMVRGLVDRFYSGATRYTTNAFLRTKLGDALSQRSVAPHIFESPAEAQAHLQELQGKAAG